MANHSFFRSEMASTGRTDGRTDGGGIGQVHIQLASCLRERNERSSERESERTMAHPPTRRTVVWHGRRRMSGPICSVDSVEGKVCLYAEWMK